MKIKHSYIAKTAGMNESKLSRILNDKQNTTCADMEKLSKAAGQSIQFFLCNEITSYSFLLPKIERTAFCSNNYTKEQKNYLNKLLELMENIDEILSAEFNFRSIISYDL